VITPAGLIPATKVATAPGASNVIMVAACEKLMVVSKREMAPAGSVVRRKCERFSELLAIGVVVVDLNKFIIFSFFSRLLTLRLHRSERGDERPERRLSFTLPQIQILFNGKQFEENRVNLSSQAAPNFYVGNHLARLWFVLTTQSARSSAIDANGRTIWIVDAHRGDGRRFIVHADEKLSAFIELERQALTVTFYLASIQ
jgi:hypothetical protein